MTAEVKAGKRRVTIVDGPEKTRKKKKNTARATARATSKKDSLDTFLDMMDDPDYWRTVTNPQTGEEIRLTREELEIIHRIQKGDYADAAYDPYEPYVDFFTHTVMPVPLSAAPEPKRRFVPSKWEALKVARYIYAMRKGRMALPKSDEQEAATREKAAETVYDIWSGEVDAAVLAAKARHIAAPKIALPDHRESYNPPAEYLLSEEERAEWEAMDPEDRPYNFVPQKYAALRLVPGYGEAVKERYGRCLDLFLCPRAIKNKIVMNPDDLLPTLPDPRDLRPFPTNKSISFVGHTEGVAITSISIDPTGQWLLSAAADGHLKLWDVQTGHCRATWHWGGSKRINGVAWNPSKGLFMFAVAVDAVVFVIIPADMALTESTHAALEALQQSTLPAVEEVKSNITWKQSLEDEQGIVYSLEHAAEVLEVQWHRRGDYFASLCPAAPSGAQVLAIHQLSRRQSQHPFKKMPGIMRAIRFHPTQPHLVLATQKSVRVYDLVRREQVKKLISGVQSISSVAVHAGGDNLIVGSHDMKLCWFDLDYSVRPYRVLCNHRGAIRSVAFHPAAPLMASAGDDGIVQVIHAQVYADLSSNPLIVPVKTLADFAGSTVTQVIFHPVQPWLLAANSQGSIALFV